MAESADLYLSLFETIRKARTLTDHKTNAGNMILKIVQESEVEYLVKDLDSKPKDILDYLKLISNNYYLDFIELNNNEVIKAPNEFINIFNKILENFNSKIELNEEKQSMENNNKIMIMINQSKNLKNILDGKSLFNTFMNYWREKFEDISYKEHNIMIFFPVKQYYHIYNRTDHQLFHP